MIDYYYPWAERREFLHHDKTVNEYRDENKIWRELYDLLVLKIEELPHDNIDIKDTFNEIHFQCVRAFLIENPESKLDDSVKISKKLLHSKTNAYICHCAVYALLSKVLQKSKSINLLLKVYEKRLAKQVPEWFEVFKDFANTISAPEYEEPNFNPTPLKNIFYKYKNDCTDESDFTNFGCISSWDLFYGNMDLAGLILFTKLWHEKDDQIDILVLIKIAKEYLEKEKYISSDEEVKAHIEEGFTSEFYLTDSDINKLIKCIREKGSLYESMPGLYELDKGTYKDIDGNLCGGTYRIPMQTNKVEKSADSPTADTETQTINKENLIQELTKYFKNTEDAKEFCESILKAEQEEMPRIYASYKYYNKVEDLTTNRAIYSILKSHKLYSCSESNWNGAISKRLKMHKEN